MKERLRRVLERHPEVVFAYLHGSFLVTDHFRDVDVAVYVNGVENYTEYELSLAVELERETGAEVDVRVLNDAPPAFRYRAVKGEPLIDRDPERRFRFIEETVWEYLDYEPLERRMRRELLAG
ncbi:nucleotidyltransferase domain-containing protein [Thermococcus sp. Bubb.Bath]|uniref:nucleotidyltransferase domain-containing protein n=1 Tax=Thermococcus sp. Bubb.Bath TaxID=1638242 RepID=UPI00143B11F0|nr:nucleotidyltransferase domain-containing protein [Thermococcus sp. Bubb.Bath]